MTSKIGKLRLCLLSLCSLIATPAESATNRDWVQTDGGCYAANVASGNLFNRAGLPASPFRSNE